MVTENPFHKNVKTPQHVSWRHLKLGREYHFELIIPFKAIIHEFSERGGYLLVCAEVLEGNGLNPLSIQKGEFIVVDFAIRTFTRAWRAVNYTFRNQFEEGDNLRLKFKKDSKQSLEFIELERLEPSEEHIRFANSVYNDPYLKKNEEPKLNKTEEI